MKLIIGLGNPGKEYEKTRHNVGWMVLDKLACLAEANERKQAGNEKWSQSKHAKLLYLRTKLNGQEVELIKPLTFMNNSGEAVAYASKKHNLKAEDIFVIYDDVDLPLGKIRIGKFESSGGHNGIKSIIDHLKNKNFIRFRIGINKETPSKIPADKLVLQKFGLLEKSKINFSIEKTVEAITTALTEPLDNVMNRFN